MKKRILRLLMSLAVMLVSLPLLIILAAAASYLVNEIYEMLYRHLPSVFPLYDPIGQKDEHEAQVRLLGIISLALAEGLWVLLLLRWDNARDEHIIAKTDGLFDVGDILSHYLGEFMPTDAIASVIIGTGMALPAVFIPSGFLRGDTLPAYLLRPLTNLHLALTPVGAAVFNSLALIAFYLAWAVPVLKYYRAKWLSGFSLYVGGEG